MKLDCVHPSAGNSYLDPSYPMRMRRSSRQCEMSASHASCSFLEQGLDPPSHTPLIIRQSGVGICCPCGEYSESCAQRQDANPRMNNGARRRPNLSEDIDMRTSWVPKKQRLSLND